MGSNKRQGSTHYRSKRRYADALQARNYGEVIIDLGDVVSSSDGESPLATGEINASGSLSFFRITSGDERNTFFRIPADFDATATSYIHYTYAIASSTATSADTITTLTTYQIPSASAVIGAAGSSEGVTDTAISPAASAKGTLAFAETSLSSAFTGTAGGFVHLQVETHTPCAADKEVRLYNKAVFRYAKDYI